MRPIPAGLVVRSASRSANSLGSATVTALNTVELAITVTTRAITTRRIAPFDTRAAGAACLWPVRTLSRTRAMNQMPIETAARPVSPDTGKRCR